MEHKLPDLPESLWRRQPAAPERDIRRARPELQAEVRLTEALAQIPDAPVASNFTSRVMAAIDREESRAARSGWRWNVSLLLPRLAFATAVLFFAGLGVQHYAVSSHRTTLARNIALVATSHPLPSVDALENLDAITRMGQSTHADGELLADLE